MKINGENILVVEDDRITSRLIQKYIKNLGYNLSAAVATGEEAVKYAREKTPHIVLMDITLEGEMDGIESARIIYEELNIPIIYITSSSDDSTMDRAKDANPFGFIIKPIDIKELKAVIEMSMLRYNMENKLIENEEKYSTILESIGDAVVVTNFEGEISYMNPVAENMTGYMSDEVAGLKADSIVNIDSVEISSPAGKGMSENSAIRNYIISKNENRIPVDYTSSPQKDNRGNYLGTVMVFRDITRQVKSEDSLHESFRILRKAMGGVIQAMAQTVESKDPYTAGHQRRVSSIARLIADEMRLDSDKIEGIRLAGVIHDLGKISIPAEILSKPGRITDIEFTLIKNHPQTAYDILKTIDFPWPIAEIVLQHHERINGSGYPRGLSDDEILIEAKIIAVADVVEAMAAHRPYRPSLGLDLALNEIKKNKGIIYDLEAAETCLEVFSRKDFSFDDL